MHQMYFKSISSGLAPCASVPPLVCIAPCHVVSPTALEPIAEEAGGRVAGVLSGAGLVWAGPLMVGWGGPLPNEVAEYQLSQ